MRPEKRVSSSESMSFACGALRNSGLWLSGTPALRRPATRKSAACLPARLSHGEQITGSVDPSESRASSPDAALLLLQDGSARHHRRRLFPWTDTHCLPSKSGLQQSSLNSPAAGTLRRRRWPGWARGNRYIAAQPPPGRSFPLRRAGARRSSEREQIHHLTLMTTSFPLATRACG